MNIYYTALNAVEIYLGLGVLMVAIGMAHESFRDALKDSIDEKTMHLPMEHRNDALTTSFMVMLFIALVIKWPGIAIWLWGDIGDDE